MLPPLSRAVALGLTLLAVSAAGHQAGAQSFQLRRFVGGIKAPPVPEPAACDADWSNVVLLLNGEGQVGDASGRHPSYAVRGSAVAVTADARFGAGALDFQDINGSALDFGADPDFDFGTGDFTVEAWVRTGASSARGLISIGPEVYDDGNALLLSLNQGEVGRLTARLNDNVGRNWDASLTSTGDAGVSSHGWTHVALSRAGTKARLFLDGQLIKTVTVSAGLSLTAGQKLVVGGFATATSADYRLVGQMDDVRLTKGVARYVAGFTPPTAGLPTMACPAS